MTNENQSTVPDKPILLADVSSCYSHAWRQLWKNFFELFLIAMICLLIAVPTGILSVIEEEGGIVAFYALTMSILYSVIILNPVDYGVSFAFLKAARSEKIKIQDMFEVFQNYLHAVLANILTGFIIGFGLICCIVPGIILACKLAFVPYLIVDRKLDAIEAVKESWRMTNGHATTVFLIGLLGVFIAILGLICCFVGIIISLMLIELAFATLYYVVSLKDEENKLIQSK
ncbi:hypothetical protein JXQ31_05360 [candidate division KSB1 bacterium]|nr:hypothetical protein [candidate division KSB1 bacterium]